MRKLKIRSAIFFVGATVVLSQANLATAYEAPAWADKVSPYARFGGGVAPRVPYSELNQTATGGSNPLYGSLTRTMEGASGLFSTELGMNKYFANHFYMAVATGLDIRFNDQYSGPNFGSTDVSGFFVDLKAKFGVYFDVSDYRLTGYGLIGLGADIGKAAGISITPNRVLLAPEVGAGFMVTSKVYPVGLYIEASVPFLIQDSITTMAGSLGFVSIQQDGFAIAPKFSAGVQIGY